MHKKLLTLLFVAISAATFAQAPQGINYQAVIRDNGGAVLANQAVGMKVAILQGSPSGTAVYEESFSPTTSQFGLVNVVIGQGTVISGDFTSIDWSAGPYYAEVSADETGGINYSVLGTQQLMSVPYSLYAETAENVANDQVDDADADPTNELQNWSNLPGIPAEITDGDDVDDADADPNNEIQAISFSNDTLYLSNGGQVFLGAYGIDLVNDADADPTNELQNWSNLPGIPAEITDGDDVDDADADPNNEYQVLALSNDTLYLSDGNSVYLGNLSFSIQNHGVRVGFSSSTIWTCPNNVYQVVVELWGGGGGGGGAWTAYGACSSSDGGDGGNGGYIMDTVSVTPGMSYSVVVGNGGNGGTWGGGAVYSGQPGEASSFGGVLSAPGGGAGTAGECVGTHGADGSIVDYNYQPLGNRSYIPSGFVQIIPGSFSPGGVGGYVYSGGGSAGQSGQNGEAGFVVISY